jgi:transcriptional regulator with XRE-family HTH domain
MDDREVLGELWRFKEARCLTDEELALILGVSRMALYRWRSGKCNLRSITKRTIMNLVGKDFCPFCKRPY